MKRALAAAVLAVWAAAAAGCGSSTVGAVALHEARASGGTQTRVVRVERRRMANGDAVDVVLVRAHFCGTDNGVTMPKIHGRCLPTEVYFAIPPGENGGMAAFLQHGTAHMVAEARRARPGLRLFPDIPDLLVRCVRASLRRVGWRPHARLTVLAIASSAAVFVLFAARPGHAGTAITLHAYAKRANAVCAAYHRKAAKLPRVQLSDFPGVVRLANAALPLVSVANRKLRAIPLPSTKRTLVKTWLRRGYRVPRLLRALKHAASLENQIQVVEADSALQANGAKRRALAHRLGMRACTRS